MKPHVYDPHIKKEYVNNYQKKYIVNNPSKNYYDAIILAVAHDEFKKLGINKILSYSKDTIILFDIKGVFPKKYSNFRLWI